MFLLKSVRHLQTGNTEFTVDNFYLYESIHGNLHKRVPPSGVVQGISRHPPSGGKYDSDYLAPHYQNDATI